MSTKKSYRVLTFYLGLITLAKTKTSIYSNATHFVLVNECETTASSPRSQAAVSGCDTTVPKQEQLPTAISASMQREPWNGWKAIARGNPHYRGLEQRQLDRLITCRSEVQILYPQEAYGCIPPRGMLWVMLNATKIIYSCNQNATYNQKEVVRYRYDRIYL